MPENVGTSDSVNQLAHSIDVLSRIGKIGEAVITKVFPHGLHCKIHGLDDLCFVPASELKRTNPSDYNIFISVRVGEKIKVQIIGRQKTKNFWLSSEISAINYEKWLKNGPQIGEKCIANIIRITPPFGVFFILSNGMYAFSSVSSNPNLWDFLKGSGRLSIGSRISVTISDWDKRGRGIRVDINFGNHHDVRIGTIHEGTVLYLTHRFLKKKKCEIIHNIAYVELKSGDVAHVYLNNYQFPDMVFSVGSKMQIEILDARSRRFYFPIIRADIISDASIKKSQLEIGKVVSAKILETSERFAICIISDFQLGLIHHSSIINENDFDARKYIHPGDWVKVRVLELINSKNIPWQDNSLRETKSSKSQPFYRLEFVALSEDAEMCFDRNPLIDLAAIRSEGKSGGFRRDRDFRKSVLEAYEYTCCICGEKYCVGSSSAMEAAHIIPKSKRGADLISNSLCFCPVHHWAFDRGYISVDRDCLIEVSNDLIEMIKEASWLSVYDGKKAHIPEMMQPDPNALDWHRDNVFLK